MESKSFDIFNAFHKQWALVTAGSATHFNTMTISWGTMGTLWSRPVAIIFIQTKRYTYEFLDNEPYFTICFFKNNYKKDLTILGSNSGRKIDKLNLTKLKPQLIDQHFISYEQAELTLLCKKIYKTAMLKEDAPEFAPKEDHDMFVGEVIQIIEGNNHHHDLKTDD